MYNISNIPNIFPIPPTIFIYTIHSIHSIHSVIRSYMLGFFLSYFRCRISSHRMLWESGQVNDCRCFFQHETNVRSEVVWNLTRIVFGALELCDDLFSWSYLRKRFKRVGVLGLLRTMAAKWLGIARTKTEVFSTPHSVVSSSHHAP